MDQLNPRPELYNQIMDRINAEQELQAFKKKLALYFFGMVFSFAALTAAFAYLFKQLSNTGFADIISLSSSNFAFISSHFSEYFLFLLNSLPIISVAVLGLILVLSFASIISFLRYVFKVRSVKNILRTF